MKKYFSKAIMVSLMFTAMQGNVLTSFAQDVESSNEYANVFKGSKPVVINGTNQSVKVTINAKALRNEQPIKISVTPGFSVTPSTLPANTSNGEVTVTLTSTKSETVGKLILRSGDTRSYVILKGIRTPLEVKDLSNSPIYKGGNDESFIKTAKNGFNPTNKGYTVEFKIKTDNPNKQFFPFMVDSKGNGVKGFVTNSGIGLFSANDQKEFPNPASSVNGGLGKFYNNDGLYHTYRYAVTPDNRIFIYRDGIFITEARLADYGHQADFATETGAPVENLLKNPNFEGEYDTIPHEGGLLKAIEGWDIAIGDKYNSQQFIVNQELNNVQDFNNHILQMKRYQWADGWSAAIIQQVVDVAPSETYSFSALARGGIKTDGSIFGKIKIEEVQDQSKGASADVTSKEWETYSMDYTTSANCKQIRAIFYLERDKWGSWFPPLEIDNAKLTGKSRLYSPKIGFDNKFANVEYFTYDLTGAYAPAAPQIITATEKEKK